MSEEHRLEARLREFAAAPDANADWADVMRRAGERPQAPRFSRRRLALALVAAVAVAASLVSIFIAHERGPASTLGGPEGVTQQPPDGSNPWGQEGRQITIEELRAEAPYLPLPNSDRANDGNVGTVWVWDHTTDSQRQGVAAAVYYPGSGIELMWAHEGLDYTGFTPPELQTIDGVPAIVLPSDQSIGPTGATSLHSSPTLSELDLPVGPDHVLTLEGRVPESELIDVARTLRPSPDGASPAGDLPPANPQPGPYLTFWDGFLVDGVTQGSVDGAAGSLAFQPVAPSSLGDPSAILETDPAQAPESDRVLSLRYGDRSSGRFWLLERPSLSTTASLLSEIASDCTRASGCKEITASMLDLGRGVSALTLENPVSDRIVWVERGVYYEVIGPASTFSAADALSVAKAVAGG